MGTGFSFKINENRFTYQDPDSSIKYDGSNLKFKGIPAQHLSSSHIKIYADGDRMLPCQHVRELFHDKPDILSQLDKMCE